MITEAGMTRCEAGRLPVLGLFVRDGSGAMEALECLHRCGLTVWVENDPELFVDRVRQPPGGIAVVAGLDRGDSLACGLVESVGALVPSHRIGIVGLVTENSPVARARALRAGADLCVSIDAETIEVISVVRALASRHPCEHELLFRAVKRSDDPRGPWRVDRLRGALLAPGDVEIRLTALELALLSSLVSASGRVFSKDELGELVYPDEPREAISHRLELLVHRVRKKGLRAGIRIPLRAVFGRGLVFVGGRGLGESQSE